MKDSATAPHLEDITSVGTRVSWGAILAGSALALGLYFLLATLGAAVGLSTSDKMNPATLQTGAIIWAFLTTIVALFVGGLVTSVFTAGENKVEAVISGVITWAVLFAFLLILGAAGVRAGFHSMQVMANNSQAAGATNWETAAKEAGVPAERIEDWRRKEPGSGDKTAQEARNQEALQAATRISWYTFAGTWLSMLAAGLGALLGAGPTFRVVAVHGPLVRTGSLHQPAVSPAYSR